LPGTQWARFYLQPDRALATNLPGDGVAPLAFIADPFDPVPTIGGAMSSGEPVMRAGAYDQRTGPGVFGARPPYGPLGERPDVLSFATPPLAEDLSGGAA
jgi:predicted acyl esterase